MLAYGACEGTGMTTPTEADIEEGPEGLTLTTVVTDEASMEG
jgi:hypothetical protein